MLGREHVFGHPALTDEVTGLANRLHFELVYSYLFEGADRGVPLTMMLVAIPEQTDRRLAQIGEIIQRVTRASDLVAHLEHGRFAILLMGANLSGGRIAADRLEMALEEIMDEPASLALAAYHPDMKEPHQLLEAADRALREVEERGGGLEMISE
jgi:GGDEF domain-containing protein